MTIDNETIMEIARECATNEVDAGFLTQTFAIAFAHRIAEMQREIDAGICDKWVDVNHVYTNGAIRCAEDIRSQK